MARITMVIETIDPADGGPDPTLIDPQEIAEGLVTEFCDASTANGHEEWLVSLVSAEWEPDHG